MIKKKKSLKYDKIISIECVGMKQTYDFEIPDTHCFFANDILVHNSSIKQDSHNIAMLWRNIKKEDQGEHEVIVDFQKVRDDSGEGGKIKYIFDPRNQRYSEKTIKTEPAKDYNDYTSCTDDEIITAKDVEAARDLFKEGKNEEI